MPYNADVTWLDISAGLGYYGLRVKEAILDGHEQYQEWVAFRNGRTDTQVATALSVDVSAIVDAEYAFSAMEELYMAATAQSVVAANRFDAIRKFT